MKLSRFTKSVVLLNCTIPVLLLAWDALHNDLGANPVNFAIRTTGVMALVFLVLSLAITPVSRIFGWSWLAPFRRVTGLYAFFHAALHFALYFVLDRAADVGSTFTEVLMLPYLIGFTSLLVMVPLAVTSTNRMIQRLGAKRWKLLHRLAYLAAIAGATHFFMVVKADNTRPLLFAVLFGGLFAYRWFAHYFQLRRDSYLYRTAGPARPTAAPAKHWSGTLRVARIFVETPEVRTFRLVLPTGSKLPFEHLPGQYLNLTLEIDGKKVRRSYTIASAPTRSGYCEITVKREERGLASRYLHDTLREGDTLQVTAPAGRFTFTGTEAERLVVIAGGVGITPLMAKIRYLTDSCWTGSIHLLLSVKTEQDLIFRTELEDLQRRFTNLKVTTTLTRTTSTTWSGERGRISAELLKRVVPDLQTSRVHLCGPTEMTEPLIALLRDLGVPADAIKVESFASPSRTTISEALPVTEPRADLDTSTATLQFARSGKTLTDLGGKTILELAEENGIDIPYDCRSGICGQCKTQVLAGTVSMDADDALDPVDRAKGIVLGCQARCQDAVVIEA